MCVSKKNTLSAVPLPWKSKFEIKLDLETANYRIYFSKIILLRIQSVSYMCQWELTPAKFYFKVGIAH